jgi:hypothetical protein
MLSMTAREHIDPVLFHGVRGLDEQTDSSPPFPVIILESLIDSVQYFVGRLMIVFLY